MSAILSSPDYERHRWLDKEAEFFAVGVSEIDAALELAGSLAPQMERTAALDFGCGVGRLTQALGRRFERAVGVDIAPSMIEQAQALAGPDSNCQFLVNDRPDLALIPSGSIDFVYSRLVLQHIPPKFALEYVSEFVRVLRPKGLALFQVPSHPTTSPRGLKRYAPSWARQAWHSLRARISSQAKIRSYCCPQREVERAVVDAHGVVLQVLDDSSQPGYRSYMYAATRPGPGRDGSDARVSVDQAQAAVDDPDVACQQV